MCVSFVCFVSLQQLRQKMVFRFLLLYVHRSYDGSINRVSKRNECLHPQFYFVYLFIFVCLSPFPLYCVSHLFVCVCVFIEKLKISVGFRFVFNNICSIEPKISFPNVIVIALTEHFQHYLHVY